MPTPSPIITARLGVNEAIDRKRSATASAISPPARPVIATTSGRPAATREPKAMSRTTSAASSPMPTDVSGWAGPLSNVVPDAPTTRTPSFACSTRSRTSPTRLPSRLLGIAAPSNVTVA